MTTPKTIRLTGLAAVRYAEQCAAPLCKYADPVEDARDDLTPDEARDILGSDPSLVYLDVPLTELGARVGRAIARDVLADDLPREWTGLDPQDGDQLTAAGVEPDTPEWETAERAAREAYLAALAADRRSREQQD